jgi:hypothetical protein
MLDNEELFRNFSRPWYILNIPFLCQSLCTLIIKRCLSHRRNNFRSLRFPDNILVLERCFLKICIPLMMNNCYYHLFLKSTNSFHSVILHVLFNLLSFLLVLRDPYLPLSSLIHPSGLDLLMLEPLSLCEGVSLNLTSAQENFTSESFSLAHFVVFVRLLWISTHLFNRIIISLYLRIETVYDVFFALVFIHYLNEFLNLLLFCQQLHL